MAKRFKKYSEHAKNTPGEVDDKQFQKIADMVEKSRAAGAKDPIKHKDKHVKVLDWANKELSKLKKNTKDQQASKFLDEVIKQTADEIKMLSQKVM